MTISACIIAHNEEHNIERTLSALQWVDEIVLVDCGSTDRTAEIARRYTDRVFARPNLTNLNVNKNFAFAQAASEWLLCLDADEVVPPPLASEMAARIAGIPEENGFFIRRKSSYFGRVLMHGGHFPDRQLRLFRNAKGRFAERHVHERLEVEGKIGTLHEPLEHYPYQSISQALRKLDFYTSFDAESRQRRGETFSIAALGAALLSATARFLRRYLFKGGFLDGWQGFAAAFLDFVSPVVASLKLRERQRENRPT